MSYFPGNHNFTIYQGDTHTFLVTYNEGDAGKEEPYDLTGATITGQVRPSIDSDTVTASFNISVQNQTTNTGQFRASLFSSATADMTASSYVYDIQVVWPNNNVQTLLYGTISVTKQVTR